MRNSVASLMAVVIFIFVLGDCKSKTSDGFIVNKWKFTEVSGTDAEQIPDSLIKEMLGNTTINFKNDGTFEQTDGNTIFRKGTYGLSADGKEIYIKDNGSRHFDTVVIIQLSKDKMIITSKNRSMGADIRATLTPR